MGRKKKRPKKRKLTKKKRMEIKELQEKIDWMQGNAPTPSYQRALEAEKKVSVALEYFKRKKIKFDGKTIKNIVEFPHWSSEDRSGIDKKIEFQNGEIKIQVKNHWTLAEEKKYQEQGICMVAVWPKEDKEKAKERVFQGISNFLQLKDEERKRGEEERIKKERLEASVIRKLQRFLKKIFSRILKLISRKERGEKK